MSLQLKLPFALKVGPLNFNHNLKSGLFQVLNCQKVWRPDEIKAKMFEWFGFQMVGTMAKAVIYLFIWARTWQRSLQIDDCQE